jgi:hypothetical protein
VADGQQAVRIVRQRAAEWGIAPNRIGIMGFSAGAGVPIELHVFESGGHGWGMRKQDKTSDHWIDEFGWWLESRGLIKHGLP